VTLHSFDPLAKGGKSVASDFVDASRRTHSSHPARSLRSFAAAIPGFQADVCIGCRQGLACHLQIRQREQCRPLRGLVLQPAVAHLDVPELALADAERMLDLGSDAGLQALELADQRVDLLRFT
jgi:hypothetical protein